MTANLVNVLRSSIIAKFTFDVFISRPTFILFFLSLVAFDIVSHLLWLRTIFIDTTSPLVIEQSTRTEIILHFVFAMRTVIDNCLALVHDLLIKSIPAFFTIHYEVSIIAVITHSLRAHFFSQNIETDSRTAIRTLAVLKINVAVFAVSRLKKAIVFSTERNSTFGTWYIFSPSFTFATPYSLSDFKFFQMKFGLFAARTNRVNQIFPTPALITRKSLKNSYAFINRHLSPTRTSNRFILQLALFTFYCFSHSIVMLVSEEKFTASDIWTAKEESTLIAVIAANFLAIIRFLQYHCFLGLIAVRTEPKSPVDEATFLVTYMCIECFS